MDNCFICNRKVLRFEGECAFFDSYMFGSTYEDALALEAGAYGFAHALCLKNSVWGDFWSKKREWHYGFNLGQRPIASEGGYRLFLNRNTMEFSLVSELGLLTYLKKTDLKSKKPFEGGYLLAIKSDFHEKVPPGPLAQAALDRIADKKDFSLFDLAKIWGQEDSFLHPELVAMAKFESERNLKRYFQGKLQSLKITFKVFIPASLAETIEKIS